MKHNGMPSGEGDINPVVFVENGQVRATSRDVAACFGKRHVDVVRAIRALLAEEVGFSQRTFALIEYADERGRQQPAYSMDRDGFRLLAMGFTGPNALRFKRTYIQAFQRMESELRAREPSEAPPDHREFPNWPLEEMRAKSAVIEMYRKACGPLAAQWAMPQVGFPVPPTKMIELGRQLLLDLDGGRPDANS